MPNHTSTGTPEVVIPVTLPQWEAERLSALIDPDQGLPDLEAVIYQLLDHAQQGVYRSGAWERSWLQQVFGHKWTERMEPAPERTPSAQRPAQA